MFIRTVVFEDSIVTFSGQYAAKATAGVMGSRPLRIKNLIRSGWWPHLPLESKKPVRKHWLEAIN